MDYICAATCILTEMFTQYMNLSGKEILPWMIARVPFISGAPTLHNWEEKKNSSTCRKISTTREEEEEKKLNTIDKQVAMKKTEFLN